MRFALAILAALLVAAPAQAACKLALVLGIDISSSVDPEEYRLQLDGLADALESPGVIEAILDPPGAHIAAAAYEWSGYPQQDVIAPWAELRTAQDVRRFANRLRAHPRPYWDFATAVGISLQYGANLLAQAPDCARRVIDLSGDGVNNIGPEPAEIYATGQMEGITVNGLVILGADPDPLPYYRNHVIFGPKAFVAVASDFRDYRRAMEGKLIREISDLMILGER